MKLEEIKCKTLKQENIWFQHFDNEGNPFGYINTHHIVAITIEKNLPSKPIEYQIVAKCLDDNYYLLAYAKTQEEAEALLKSVFFNANLWVD